MVKSICRMMKLEPLGRRILAIFLAMAYLAEKMSTIVKRTSAARDGILQECCEKTKSINVFNTIKKVECYAHVA